jgi:hypothetical protein
VLEASAAQPADVNKHLQLQWAIKLFLLVPLLTLLLLLLW